MKNINRHDIQVISRHSNWSADGIEETLQQKVYNGKKDWQQFLKLLFISLGVSFTTAGILFFFAYNWNNLHKFVKIGLIGSLIIGLTLFVVFSKKTKPLIKNIILTGVSVLVGVLFAVFGQVYQTGANAYDFFLGWTMAVTLWVVIANFVPLWFVFILLINTTLFLYNKQVVDWDPLIILGLLVAINTFFFVGSIFVSNERNNFSWLQKILAIAIVYGTTIGVMMGIFEIEIPYFGLFLLFAIALYVLGIFYSFKTRNTFYIAIIALSLFAILNAFFIKVFDLDETVLLLISIFVLIAVTALVRYLMKLQKKWDNE